MKVNGVTVPEELISEAITFMQTYPYPKFDKDRLAVHLRRKKEKSLQLPAMELAKKILDRERKEGNVVRDWIGYYQWVSDETKEVAARAIVGHRAALIDWLTNYSHRQWGFLEADLATHLTYLSPALSDLRCKEILSGDYAKDLFLKAEIAAGNIKKSGRGDFGGLNARYQWIGEVKQREPII